MLSVHPLRILSFLLCLLTLVAVGLSACEGGDEGTAPSAPVTSPTSDGITSTSDTVPSTDTSEGLVQMPFIMGLLEAEAEALLATVGLGMDPSVYWTTFPGEWGRLISQGPYVEGSWVPIGTTIPVEVGAHGVIVADVVGWYLADAEAELASRGLDSEVHLVPDLVYSGSVIAQDPPGGLVVAPGTTVDLDVQRYAIELANLVGMTTEQVQDYCSGYHLALDIEYVTTLSLKQIGKVLTQDPAPGTVLMEDVGSVSVTIGKATAISLPRRL